MRLYGKLPSHVDGHQHRHLCANMLIDPIIPEGQIDTAVIFPLAWRKEHLKQGLSCFGGQMACSPLQSVRLLFFAWSVFDIKPADARRGIGKGCECRVNDPPDHREEYEYLVSDRYSGLLIKVERASFERLLAVQT